MGTERGSSRNPLSRKAVWAVVFGVLYAVCMGWLTVIWWLDGRWWWVVGGAAAIVLGLTATMMQVRVQAD
ncbi:hypothetical protein GONAM_54_00100 [Gordonia namibiensis NBRC 108229]|uniref:Uncharacterized protein n=1 Tax=Gordonia namibiensis NBRC 108229 TaxID=1208314 RepID=K6XDF1_9ACTN|nr:hypothetical protein [Gordonia namibiensis]GAC02383.1 hypothetical protein GONAM_54_00100 [Gordonia namibiensis NBRC 108229]